MMKPTVVLLVTATLALTGCGKKPDTESATKSVVKKTIAVTPAQKMAKAYLTEMDKMASAIESVTDAKSAEKAALQIGKINVRMEALNDKYSDGGNKLGMATVMMSHQQEFIAIQTRVSSAMMNFAGDPALMKTMTDAMAATPKLK